MIKLKYLGGTRDPIRNVNMIKKDRVCGIYLQQFQIK